jgi:hypothetical protein
MKMTAALPISMLSTNRGVRKSALSWWDELIRAPRDLVGA